MEGPQGQTYSMSIRVLTTAVLLISLPFTTWGLSLNDESKGGKEVHLEVLKSSRLNNDPYVGLYVGRIVKGLERNAGVPFPVKLTIIESAAPNAFATMGGYVYATTGLIEMADREEEIAGVLSHELAHAGRRHVVKRMQKEKPLSIAMVAALLLGALVPGGASVGPAIATSTMAAAQTLSLKYSREDEDEADRVGLATAERAGYSGHGLADFLKKIRATEYEKAIPQYLLTHPYSDERAAKIESMITLPKTTASTDLFPYIVARLKILEKPFSPAIEDTWLKKYEKDSTDPLSSYGAALVYNLKGNRERAQQIIQNMDSPYKNLFLGEILIRGQRFKEAMEILRNETDPIALYLLASAYEGGGDLSKAMEVLRGLLSYKDTLPIVYQKYGMVVGRLGYEALGYEYLGKYHLQIGKPASAQVYFEKAVAKYGRNTQEAKEAEALLEETKGKKPDKDGEKPKGERQRDAGNLLRRR